jgi:CBS domain-containing protein
MRVCEVMTRFVLTIPPEATIQEAARKMRTYHIGILPVSDHGKMLGVVSDRDIAIRAVADAKHAKLTSVREIMSVPAISCLENHDLETACSIMESHRVRRLLVVDHGNRLAGIVSLEDIATRAHKERLSGQVLRSVAHAS